MKLKGSQVMIGSGALQIYNHKSTHYMRKEPLKHVYLGVAVRNVPVRACQPGAHCVQHPDAVGGWATARDVAARILGHSKVNQLSI